MHGVDAKKVLPVNLSLYIDDIGKHFGTFRCLLKKTAICLYFYCLDTQFPGAIALEYLEGGTQPVCGGCCSGRIRCLNEMGSTPSDPSHRSDTACT